MVEMSHVQIRDHTPLPSCPHRARGLPVTHSSWFTCDKVLWILRAPSQVFDDRRIGCNVKKWSKTCEEWHQKDTFKTYSKIKLAQYTTFSVKSFLKMRQSVIWCKYIPLHSHILQLLIVRIRTVELQRMITRHDWSSQLCTQQINKIK